MARPAFHAFRNELETHNDRLNLCDCTKSLADEAATTFVGFRDHNRAQSLHLRWQSCGRGTASVNRYLFNTLGKAFDAGVARGYCLL